MKRYQSLIDRIGITIAEDKLRSVFIHRSYLNEHDEEHSNERLEFLGDAVLELITTAYLYHLYGEKQEGELTAIRAALVRRSQLATVARDLDLGQYLLFSKGEELAGGADKDYILANTLEALIGCIYLEKGYEIVEQMVTSILLEKYATEIVASHSYIDAKSKLQEILQEKFSVTPHYEMHGEQGPDHDKVFHMAVKMKDEVLAIGEGSSKRKAEEQAAFKALEERGWM